jgi:hypothetical protein
MKGFKDSKGNFHPITQSKGVRSRRDTTNKTQGVKIRKGRWDDNDKRFMVSQAGVELKSNEIKPSIETDNLSEAIRLIDKGGYTEILDLETGNKIRGDLKKRDVPKLDPAYGLLVANGYEKLKHNPNDPRVKKAYNIFVKETLEQARKLQKQGIKFQSEEYKDANAMFKDVEENKHLLYRPSDNDYKGVEDHPMFQLTNIRNTNGDRMRVNDVFRAIHDINGHEKSKSQFTPKGELNSYVEHKKLYSKDATRALFTETQGQGLWVNFNKKTGKKNRELQKIGDFNELDFPKQKAGIFSDKIIFGSDF